MKAKIYIMHKSEEKARKIIKKKHFMVLFYEWGSTASRLEPLQGGSLLFILKSPEIPGIYSLYQHWKDWRLSLPCSHPVVLNMGPLNWESSTLTTRPLLHIREVLKRILINQLNRSLCFWCHDTTLGNIFCNRKILHPPFG